MKRNSLGSKYPKSIVASVIPVHNRRNITLDCLERLCRIDIGPKRQNGGDVENDSNGVDIDWYHKIVVVDDGSTDGSKEAIESKFSEVIVLRGDGGLWWAGAVNMGVEYCLAQGFDLIHIMNDDIEFEEDFLAQLLSVYKENRIVGSVALFGNARDVVFKAGMRETGRIHPIYENLFNGAEYGKISHHELLPVDAVSGRSMLLPAKILKEIGLFDQPRLPHGGADQEFCKRAIKHGYRVYVAPRSVIFALPDIKKDLANRLLIDSRIGFAKTLFDLRFSWHLPTVFALNMAHRNVVFGIAGFIVHAMIIMRWTLLKLIIPPTSFKTYVRKHFSLDVHM